MIIVRYRVPLDAPWKEVRIDESKDAFAVLQKCFERIDALEERSPAAQASSLPGASIRKGAADEGAPLSHGKPADPDPAASPSSSARSDAPSTVTPARPGVRDTSMIAYRSLEWSGRMTKQQKLLMDFFAINPQRDFTRQELANALGLGINAVCGRVNELMRSPFALLEELGRRRCRITGESAHRIRAKLVQAKEAA